MLTEAFILCLATLTSPEIVDFEFLDASQRVYRSTDLASSIRHHYGPDVRVSFLVLIETPSLRNVSFREQARVLGRLDAETLGFIQIVASQMGESIGGYHVSTETASRLAGRHRGFRISLLDAEGRVLRRSKVPLSARQVLAAAKKANRIAAHESVAPDDRSPSVPGRR